MAMHMCQLRIVSRSRMVCLSASVISFLGWWGIVEPGYFRLAGLPYRLAPSRCPMDEELISYGHADQQSPVMVALLDSSATSLCTVLRLALRLRRSAVAIELAPSGLGFTESTSRAVIKMAGRPRSRPYPNDASYLALQAVALAQASDPRPVPTASHAR